MAGTEPGDLNNRLGSRCSKVSPGAGKGTVNKYKDIAGDGDLDERCRRIVAYWKKTGFFDAT